MSGRITTTGQARRARREAVRRVTLRHFLDFTARTRKQHAEDAERLHELRGRLIQARADGVVLTERVVRFVHAARSLGEIQGETISASMITSRLVGWRPPQPYTCVDDTYGDPVIDWEAES